MNRVPCTISCTADLLKMIDKRAVSLSLTRSAYITQVLRQDILTGKPNLNIIAQGDAAQVAAFGGMINNHGAGKKRGKKK